MKKPAYTEFTFNGQTKGFETYMEFATWFFSISRRVMAAHTTPETFKRLNRAATSSKEARQPACAW